jgi:hypothetical protein
MSSVFSHLVANDSAEAWEALKHQMPWTSDDSKYEWLKELGFALLEPDAEEYLDNTNFVLGNLPLYSEDYLDPVIVLGEGFYPYIHTCLSMVLVRDRLEGVDSSPVLIQDVSGDLYKSELSTERELPVSLVSNLLVACPRCQISFTSRHQAEEFDPDDDDWIQDDCVACDGSGEWEFELV